MVNVADWILASGGDDVVDAVRQMERWPSGERDKRLTANTFRPLESLYDPADYRELTTLLRDDTVRQSASRLRAEVTRIVANRHWKWLLLHPGLKDSQIHPERRMSLYSTNDVVMRKCA